MTTADLFSFCSTGGFRQSSVILIFKDFTMELYTYNAFRELSIKISASEYRQLEESILKHGCLTPIITWGDVIIDGHKRYAICKKYDIPFSVDEKYFGTYSEAQRWARVRAKRVMRERDGVTEESVEAAIAKEDVKPMLPLPPKPIARQNEALNVNHLTSADMDKFVQILGDRFGVNFLKELVFVLFHQIVRKQDKEAVRLLFQQLYNLNFIPAFQKENDGLSQF
jgi:hypothetical protein